MMTDLTNHILGSYRLLRKIGGGGMADVYQAYDSHSSQLVALKVLSPHLWQDTESLERFRREARNAAGLRHPNIVPVYESGVAEGYPYLAMAYVEGGSLADWLAWQRGPLPLARAVGILDQVAAALDYAHARGLVHRDVKPSNVLLTRDGQALLGDFGIAKAAWESRLTQTGTRIGTPAYMAPEQARGQAVDRRTDVYALGVVLYEMVTGRPPFQGETDAVLYQHVHEPPPPPRALNPALPPAAEQAILRALAKDPVRRYRTAGELAAAFRRAVEPATRVAPPGALKPPTPGQRRAGPATPIRQSIPVELLGLAGMIGAVLLVAAIALLLPRSRLPLAQRSQFTAMPASSPMAMETPTPLATSAPPLSPPELREPQDNATIEAKEVALSWEWVRPLETGEWFQVTVTREGGQGVHLPEEGKVQGGSITLDFQALGMGPGRYTWTVAVMWDNEGKEEERAAAAPLRAFEVREEPTPKPVLSTPHPSQASAPTLTSPPNGTSLTNMVPLEWSGSLVDGQVYQVRVWQVGGAGEVENEKKSAVLTEPTWPFDPGGTVGEWHWTVSVVDSGVIVATSVEWKFWYNPFPSGGATAAPAPPPR